MDRFLHVLDAEGTVDKVLQAVGPKKSKTLTACLNFPEPFQRDLPMSPENGSVEGGQWFILFLLLLHLLDEPLLGSLRNHQQDQE